MPRNTIRRVRTTLLSTACLLSCMISIASAAEGEKATGFRGDGSGKYPAATPPLEWSDTKNLKWKMEVDPAYASPILVGDKVVVASETDRIVCLNAADGKILWNADLRSDKDLPKEVIASFKKLEAGNKMCGFAAATPASDGSSIYAVFGTGAVVAYSLDGKRKWIAFFEPAAGTFGHSASPLVADGKVFVNLAHMLALDAQTGKVAWDQPAVPNAYGTSALTKLNDTLVLVTPMGQVVRASDGKVLATDIVKDLGGDEYSISPIVEDSVAYFIDEKASAAKLTLTGDSVKSELLWQIETKEPAFASPVIKDGVIYAIGKSANYTVIDAKTGKKLLEKVLDLPPANGTSDTHDNAVVYPSVTLGGTSLFMGNDKGDTFVVAAQPDYKELGRNTLPEGTGASPVMSGSALYLRSGRMLYCFGK